MGGYVAVTWLPRVSLYDINIYLWPTTKNTFVPFILFHLKRLLSILSFYIRYRLPLMLSVYFHKKYRSDRLCAKGRCAELKIRSSVQAIDWSLFSRLVISTGYAKCGRRFTTRLRMSSSNLTSATSEWETRSGTACGSNTARGIHIII